MNLLASLRYLIALSEHRHFARAAQACHITQPALSNAIRALEKEFGAEIVRRGRTYAGLTSEGERILLTARRMVHEHEQLQGDLVGRGAHPQGKLRVGVVPTALPVATLFALRLRNLHPGITLGLRSMNSQEIESGLQDVTLDLAFGFSERTDGKRGRFDVLEQYREHYFLVRGIPDPASRSGPECRWADAAAMPLCLLSPDMHNRFVVDRAFAEAGAEVRPVMETNSVSALVMSIGGGTCTILPGALLPIVPRGAGMEIRALVEPQVTTAVSIIRMAGTTPSGAIEAALAFARSDAWAADLRAFLGAAFDSTNECAHVPK